MDYSNAYIIQWIYHTMDIYMCVCGGGLAQYVHMYTYAQLASLFPPWFVFFKRSLIAHESGGQSITTHHHAFYIPNAMNLQLSSLQLKGQEDFRIEPKFMQKDFD